MDKLIAAFPNNIEEALVIAENSTFQTPKDQIRNVVICGMGGSGIGGKLVSFWVQNEIKVPVQCFHDYTKIRLPDKFSLNSFGVQPFFFLKILLKFEMLLKPQL